MFFTKISTVKKVLSQLRGKLAWLKKVVLRLRRYVVNILEIEARIQHLERVERSFGLSAKRVFEFGKVVYSVSSGSSADCYIVRPREFDPHFRCECGDAFHRGVKCKHQIAVERRFGISFESWLAELVTSEEVVADYRKSIFG